jgi:hypothetical protein
VETQTVVTEDAGPRLVARVGDGGEAGIGTQAQGEGRGIDGGRAGQLGAADLREHDLDLLRRARQPA